MKIGKSSLCVFIATKAATPDANPSSPPLLGSTFISFLNEYDMFPSRTEMTYLAPSLH